MLPSAARLIVVLLLPIFALFSCATKIRYRESTNLIIDDRLGNHGDLQNWLQPFTDSIALEMNQIVGFAAQHYANMRSKGRITQEQDEHAELSRIVSDWTLDFAKEWALNNAKTPPEMAILNHHGLRRNLDSGNISVGTIFEIMPFDNEVVLLTLSGNQMIELFNFVARLGGSPISGAEIHIGDTQFVNAIIGGNRFDSRRSYQVATIDFMQSGGDGFTMLKNPKSQIKTGVFLRDVMLSKTQQETIQKGAVQPRKKSRIIHVPKSETDTQKIQLEKK
jgi:2',3'-cyclic-nucleotide 2'-phosphodiesterase (5'-nucleotidase family)